MEEILYEKLKENEEKIKRLGPHISGLVNAGCNIALYPLFQISTQLQLSPYTSPNYSGKDFKSKLESFIFDFHSANKPFSAPKFHNYTSVVLWNSLQGPLSFYKGYSHTISSFYLSILSRSVVTSYFHSNLKDLSFTNKILAGDLIFRSGYMQCMRNRLAAFVCSSNEAYKSAQEF
jgi:hypothetical protein